jgi:hypothetical protein
MLWSDRLVMVIDNNRNNSADKEEDTLWKMVEMMALEMMSRKVKSEKRCQHQFRNFILVTADSKPFAIH